MSNCKIEEFLKFVESDKNLLQELIKLEEKFLHENSKEKTVRSLIEYIIPFARKLGFEFSFDDLAKFDLKQEKLKTLSFSELDKVSGGAGNLHRKLLGLCGAAAMMMPIVSSANSSFVKSSSVKAEAVITEDEIEQEIRERIDVCCKAWDELVSKVEGLEQREDEISLDEFYELFHKHLRPSYNARPRVLSHEEFLRESQKPGMQILYRGITGRRRDSDNKYISSEEFSKQIKSDIWKMEGFNSYPNVLYFSRTIHTPLSYSTYGEREEDGRVLVCFLNRNEVKIEPSLNGQDEEAINMAFFERVNSMNFSENKKFFIKNFYDDLRYQYGDCSHRDWSTAKDRSCLTFDEKDLIPSSEADAAEIARLLKEGTEF